MAQSTQIKISISPNLKARLEQGAKEAGISVSSYARQLIERGLSASDESALSAHILEQSVLARAYAGAALAYGSLLLEKDPTEAQTKAKEVAKKEFARIMSEKV